MAYRRSHEPKNRLRRRAVVIQRHADPLLRRPLHAGVPPPADHTDPTVCVPTLRQYPTRQGRSSRPLVEELLFRRLG